MPDLEEGLPEPEPRASRGLKTVEVRAAQEEEWGDLPTDVEEEFRREAIIQAIEGLADRQKTVLHLRFGLCFQQDDDGKWLYPQGPRYKALIDEAVAGGKIDAKVWERAMSRSSRQVQPFFLTLDEVGKVMGLDVTPESIRQIEEKALKRLRKNRELWEYY